MILKRMSLAACSASRIGWARLPTRTAAQPNRMPNSTTCRRSPLAKAPTRLSGPRGGGEGADEGAGVGGLELLHVDGALDAVGDHAVAGPHDIGADHPQDQGD